MFGIGDTELLLILLFAFLLFGPDKLPGMGRTIGRGIRQFRQASDSVTKVVKSEVLDPLNQAANEDGITRPTTPELAGEGESAAPARSQETFAERRARLAKEKAEREQRLKAAEEPAQTTAQEAGQKPVPVSAAVFAPNTQEAGYTEADASRADVSAEKISSEPLSAKDVSAEPLSIGQTMPEAAFSQERGEAQSMVKKPAPNAAGSTAGKDAFVENAHVEAASGEDSSASGASAEPAMSAAPTLASMWGLPVSATNGRGEEDATDESAA